MELRNTRILVTGGAGFLGSHLVEQLEKMGPATIFVPRSTHYDLVQSEAARALYADARPDVVFHLAARVGGIGANEKNPGAYFYENMLMGAHVIEQARIAKVQKLVMTGTVCAYPKFAGVPFSEDDLWQGYPEETNAAYGIAKRSLIVMGDAYRRQYGLNVVHALPTNLYGPRDNFDLETSHVIPALILKCLQAKQRNHPRVRAWGDGTPTREFMFVKDCARGLVLMAKHYDGAQPINLGTGSEIRIRDLAERIASACGYSGEFVWDSARPNGQPRRRLNVERARELFGFQARTSLLEGLRMTVEWFTRNTRASAFNSAAAVLAGPPVADTSLL